MSERSSGSSPAVNVSEELSALLLERERYETWLKQLEAKVDSTPKAVYQRVHGDYSKRLKEVLDRVAGRTGELSTQISTLEARLTIVEREHGELRDERAEAELRHQVGEYTAEQWKEISAHTDEALNRAAGQRTEVAGDVARLREILAAATESREEPQDAEAKAEPEPEPEVKAVKAAEPEEKKVEPPALVETKEPEPAPEPAVAAPAARPSGASATAVEQPAPRISHADGRVVADQVVTAAAPVVDPSPAQAQAPQPQAQPQPQTPAQPQPAPPPPRNTPSPGTGRRTSGFDDLAFVSSLITPDERRTPAVPVPVIPADSPPPKPDRPSIGSRSSGPETPASFMKNVRGEAIKTLKCQECGTLNYPTEWYCERCGGELAAL